MPQAARIFVSYNSQNATWRQDFVAGLKATGADVWCDANMGHGQLSAAVDRELRARPIFIVVLSPTAVVSNWVQREVTAAIDLADQNPQRVILPVVAERCDIPPLWRGFLRICGPYDSGVTAREAAARVIDLLELAPATASLPPAPGAQTDTKETAMERGNGLYAQQRYLEALHAYDHALILAPQHALAWNGRGAALTALNRHGEALEALNRAVELAPTSALALTCQGNALAAAERYDEALAAYGCALDFDPKFPVAWHNTGYALAKVRRYDDALGAFERALAIEPLNPAIWNSKGHALGDLHRYDEALAAYNHALALDLKYAEVWDTKIELLRWLGRTAEAEEAERQRDAALKGQ